MVSINPTEWDLDPSWDPFIWIGLTLVGSVHVVDLSFDPCWVRPCRGHEFWYLVYPFWGYLSFFFTLIGSVHFVNYGLDPWWVRPLCGLVLTLRWVRPLCGLFEVFHTCWVRPLCGLGSWPLVGSVHFVDLYKFVTVVGSIHFMDWGLDPWWSPSTLWICISLWPWLGPSTLWTGVLTLGGVRPLCGFV